MQLKLVDNMSRKLLSAILPAIREAEEVRIAVAFVSTSGIALIDSALKRCLDRGGYLEFLVGLDLSATEPQALWNLYELSQSHTGVAMYCYADLGPSVVYHPKLYIMNAGNETTAILGSSNLTEGGLKRNLEVNAVIRAHIQEEFVSDVHAIYNELKFDPRRVEPDGEFLELYAQLCENHKRQQRSAARDRSSRQLKAAFREKAKTLRRPIPTQRDLHGWQKLVFERLPEGQFKTSDVYQFEDEFRRYYPENQHIRDKIRQILQQLRDLGLIEHPKRNTWINRRG